MMFACKFGLFAYFCQRTGLAAVWGFEIRQPVTEVDDCNIADVLFISQIYNVLLELKYNSEQMLKFTMSSHHIAKPNVSGCFGQKVLCE